MTTMVSKREDPMGVWPTVQAAMDTAELTEPVGGFTPIGEWRRACAMAALTRAVAAAAAREDEERRR